jgi:hypothetical protein
LCFAAAPASEIESVVDLARSATPEIAADALIRIAALHKLEKKRRVELLDQAFALASGSPQPSKRRSGLDRNEGPSGYFTRVYGQDLDAASLRLRAIEELLPLDPQRARQRFEEMPPLELMPVSCEEFLVYDVSLFYEVLDRVAAQTFNAKEIREGEPAKFLERYIGGITSAAQVSPAARSLASAPVRDSEFQTLLTAFAAALSRISSDDRTFSYASREAGGNILALSQLSERRETAPQIVLEAYRQFLVNHLSAARCGDGRVGNQAPRAPDYFNEALAIPPVQPLSQNETTAAKLEGEAKGLEWCKDAECLAIREQYQALVHREDGEVLQPREREENQWQSRVRDFLTALANWTQSSGLTPAEYFREKIGFYNDVLAMVPNGETREFVFRSLLNFLIQTRLPAENRLEWLLPVRQLVGRASLDPLGFGKLAGDLIRANDSVIALDMALEAIAPRSAAEIMPLL